MELSEINLLYEYNYWASTKILIAATNLTAEQFVAQTNQSYGSLRGTLVHLVGAERIWRLRCDEGVYPTSPLREDDYPALIDLLERFQEEERKMRGYLSRLSTEQLKAEIYYQNTDGQEHHQTLWQILVHVVMHGMQHRAEAASILTDFGHSPKDIDFIVYLRRNT